MPDRRAVTPWQQGIEEKVAALEHKIDQNTRLTDETRLKVDEVHETLVAIKGALKVFAWIAVALKHLTWIAGAVAAAIGLYKFGTDGTPPRIDIPK